MDNPKFTPEEYTLASGYRMHIDSRLSLPPDIVSENIGYEAAAVVNTIRHLKAESHLPISVLELGVGTGISLVSLLERVKDPSNISLAGIDIDAKSVELSHANIQNWGSARDLNVDANIVRADWNDESTWVSLAQSRYHVILFNPPYLVAGDKVRKGYESVPKHMLYAGDEHGMEHYKNVLPRIPSILSDDEGSSILVRNALGVYSGQESQAEYRDLITDVMRQIPGGSTMRGVIWAPLSADRAGSWVTISKTEEWVPPHHNPIHMLAQTE